MDRIGPFPLFCSLRNSPLTSHQHHTDDPRIRHFIADVDVDTSAAKCVVALVGVPQDIGVTRNRGRAGAYGGPDAIRSALYGMATSAVQGPLQEGSMAILDLGNIETRGKTLEQIHDEQHDIVLRCLRKGAIPIVLGGGHDVAWPTIRAFESVQKPYAVVNIDAHADVRPLKDGKAHSGSPFRQMLEHEPSVLVKGGFTEFGLQHYAVAASHLQTLQQAGMEVRMLPAIRSNDLHAVWDSVVSRTPPDVSLYVSLDMDAFSSAFAPGVSAPSADGFTPHEVAYCVEQAGASGKLRAFDVVEMNPTYDVDGRTAKLAATMIMNVLKGLADSL